MPETLPESPELSPESPDTRALIIRSEAMAALLKNAEEKAKNGESFEDAVLNLLASDGYTGGMYPALKEALDKRDIPELVRIANMDGWL